MCSNGFELVGIAKHYVFDLGLRYTMHWSDHLDRLSLLLLLDLLLVLFGLVVEFFDDLVLDFLLALIVKAKISTLLGIVTTTLAAGLFFLGFLGLQAEQLLVNLKATRLIKLLQFLFVS